MQQETHNSNSDRAARLIDLLPDPGASGFGSAVLRLAHLAAAAHRAEAASQGGSFGEGLTVLDLFQKDTAGHGSPSDARSAGDSRPVTREGNR